MFDGEDEQISEDSAFAKNVDRHKDPSKPIVIISMGRMCIFCSDE